MISVEIKKCFDGPLSETTTDEELYNYFLKYIYQGDLKLHGSNIKVFTTPVVDGKMQGFFHITTKVQKQFNMKIRMKEPRAFFINHIPKMIGNFEKCSTCQNNECQKIKVWTAPYKNTKRTKLLYISEEYNYIIILEQKKNDWYLITSYLIEEKDYFRKILREYNKYKKTPKKKFL